ncbi:hypothetical protein TB2_017971 [Malus domestica]
MELMDGLDCFVEIPSSGWGWGCSLGWGWADGRVDQARMRELATRKRWKIAEAFLVAAVTIAGCREWSLVSSAQRFWMSLKEEKEKGEDGDCVS